MCHHAHSTGSQMAESVNRALFTYHTLVHKTTRNIPGGLFSNWSSGCDFLWSLKDDKAKEDVIRAKQKQHWGISTQLKTDQQQLGGHMKATLNLHMT